MASAIYYGAVINPISLDAHSSLPRCLLAVDDSGTIEWIVDNVENHDLQDVLAEKGLIDPYVVEIPDGTFIMPGFIDTHTVCKSHLMSCTARSAEALGFFSTRPKFRILGR